MIYLASGAEDRDAASYAETSHSRSVWEAQVVEALSRPRQGRRTAGSEDAFLLGPTLGIREVEMLTLGLSRNRAPRWPNRRLVAQYSPLITKYEPRMVPASFDFWRANLNEPNSAGTSIPSESLNPTARFGFGPSRVYRTLIESPLS